VEPIDAVLDGLGSTLVVELGVSKLCLGRFDNGGLFCRVAVAGGRSRNRSRNCHLPAAVDVAVDVDVILIVLSVSTLWIRCDSFSKLCFKVESFARLKNSLSLFPTWIQLSATQACNSKSNSNSNNTVDNGNSKRHESLFQKNKFVHFFSSGFARHLVIVG
jgi:hypothetical protein